MDDNVNEVYYKPEFLSIPSYDNEDLIREKFPALKTFNRSHQIDHFRNSNYYVIRSKKTDDIHKGVKYGVWTSSPQNNQKIEENFRIKQQSNLNTFFFFTYINSPGFVGVAVLDDVEATKEFPFFGEIGRWVGVMYLRWIYVRDVLFDEVADLKEIGYSGEYRRMNEMTDGSRLSQPNALRIIELMNMNRPLSHVFEKFVGHDYQEKKMRPNVEEIIRTNMMDIYKKKAQRKMDSIKTDEKKEEEKEKVEIVIQKKLTQGEMKKLKKQQQQKEKQTEN